MGKFLQLVGQHQEMKTMCFSHAEVTENYNGDGNFLFQWSGIKWYDSFPEVTAINEFMEWCHDAMIEDKNFPEDRQPSGDEFFRFVRVGEETDDIVQDGYCEDFHIYTQTSIEVD